MKRIVFAAIAGCILLFTAPPAFAACHEFTVRVSPATVNEGVGVTVTVERDAAVAPSQVDVVSINETARSGQDFVFVQRTVSFENETEQSFVVSTIENAVPEPNETFRLHLGNASGCLPTSEFSYGPDARVTIRDDDAAPSPTPTQTQQATSSPAATRSPTPSPTPGVTGTPSPSPTPVLPSETPSDTPTLPEPTASELAQGPGDDDVFSGGRLAVMIAGGVLLAGAAAGLLALFRGRPQL